MGRTFKTAMSLSLLTSVVCLGWLGWGQQTQGPEQVQAQGPLHPAAAESVESMRGPDEIVRKGALPFEAEVPGVGNEAGGRESAPVAPSDPFEDKALEDLSFEQIFQSPSKSKQFLNEKLLTEIKPWDSYPEVSRQSLDAGDMLGRFEGSLDQGKGRIFVVFEREAKDGYPYAGRVSVQIFGPDAQPIAKSVTLTADIGQKLRLEGGSKGLLLHQHKDHRFMFQIFRGQSDTILLGNVYEYDGWGGLVYFAQFKAQKTASP